MATATPPLAANKALDKMNASLNSLQPLVSNEMKMLMALELKCTTRTIETYLAGQGKKLPFAVELLGLVKKKVGKVAAVQNLNAQRA